ncbi:galactose-3-O-sulfotransferase 3 [Silurus asotus]|uniref:Galactose-3-O-sulfotransferase 3 n=1 Tax=Silurus asotus TaxID=30991 RepID=A0AAD5B6M5_SILAS|nr:galactose-3-O-sulfotransferase 3 [Silurus asotus]
MIQIPLTRADYLGTPIQSDLSRPMEVFRQICPSINSPQIGRPVKHTNVVFLKTHKTASSTVQNIFFRFAERNNLTVGLPVTPCDHQFCYPRLFSSHFVHPHTLPPNIVTNHLRFSRSELQRLMPNNTIYITILREPGAMFESLFSYYNQYCDSFKRVPNGSLEAFLNNPWAYYRPEEKDSMYARNTLTFDLGGDKDRPHADLERYAKRFAAEVEYTFSLVMIAEYFDESLVLLRHLLSWDLEDVLYIKQNMRMPSSKDNLSEAQLHKIRDWNAIDVALYKHFNTTLWKQLKELGLSCVDKEVKLLRHAQEQMVRGCYGGNLPRLRSAAEITNRELRPWQPSSKVAIVGYDLPINASKESGMSQDMCLKMIMPEVQYSKRLLHMQMVRYRNKYFLNTKQQLVLKQVNQQQQASTSILHQSGTPGRSSRIPTRVFHQSPQLRSHN